MRQPELIYWRGSGEVRSDLLQAIRVVGYELTVLSDIDELLKRSPDAWPGLIVVDASGGEAEASQRVIEVSAAQKLAHVPWIFLSYQATKRSAVLKKTFTKFIAVDIPFRLQDLLARLLELCPVQSSSAAAAAETSSPETAPSLAEARIPSGVAAKAQAPQIKNLDPTKLLSGHGGEFLVLAERLDCVNDQILVPDSPNRDAVILGLNQITGRDLWMGLHARRVSYLSSAVATKLGLSAERDRVIRTAGLLLNWGLKDKPLLYATHDLLLEPTEKFIRALGDAFTASAIFARERAKDPEVAQIIEQIVRIITSENVPADDPALLDATCALVPELIDRSAWSKEQWDPYGAYRAVHRLFKGFPFRFDEKVTTAVAKALSEASAIHRTLNPPAEDGREPVAIEAQREAASLFQSVSSSQVEVADLEVGMKLSSPIISWDGRLILRSNITLDSELVMRLWKLSTVRPMRPPVTVLR